jgi:cytoskeletal protein CcmA (bactofilin family)
MLNKQGLFGQNQNERYRRDARAFEPTAAPAPVPEHRVEPPPRAEPEVKPKVEETKGSKLIVGPDIKLKGAEITDCDTLVVEGRLEATLDTRVLQIAEHGAFNGVVSVDVAEIRGCLDGELTARKQLILHATARVSGKIRYHRIQVSEGAEISGEIEILDRAQSASSARTGTTTFAAQRPAS